MTRLTTKALVAILLLGAGCVPSVDLPPDRPAAALLLARAAMTNFAVDVDPSPPSDVCENCNGKGWVGDGREKFDCEFCETPWSQTPMTEPEPEPPRPGPPEPAVEPTKPKLDPPNATIVEKLAEAQKTGRGVLVVIGFQPCAPCVKLDEIIEARLDEIEQEYVVAHVMNDDAHRDGTVAEYFGATRFPFVIVGGSAGGPPIKQGVPPTGSAEEFLQWLKEK